jgi:hypothetical protein
MFIIGRIVGIVHSVVAEIWSGKLTKQGEQRQTTVRRINSIIFGARETPIKYNAACPIIDSTMTGVAADSRASKIPMIKSEHQTQELRSGRVGKGEALQCSSNRSLLRLSVSSHICFLHPIGSTILVCPDNGIGFHFHKILTPH